MPISLSRKFQQWVSAKLDLPEDVIMDIPRITMIGQFHLYIENHDGLLSFAPDEIRVLLKHNHGQLVIKGNHFVIKTILPEELLLEGIVQAIEFIKNE